MAPDGGEWSASGPDRFIPLKEPSVRIVLEAVWTPEQFWTTLKETILDLPVTPRPMPQ